MHLLHAAGSAEEVQHVLFFSRGAGGAHHVDVIIDDGDEVIEREDILSADEARLDLRRNPGILGLLRGGVGAADEELIIHFLHAGGLTNDFKHLFAFGGAGQHAGKQDIAVEDIDADVGEIFPFEGGEAIGDANFDRGIGGDLLAGAILQTDIARARGGAQDERHTTTGQRGGAGNQKGEGEDGVAHAACFLLAVMLGGARVGVKRAEVGETGRQEGEIAEIETDGKVGVTCGERAGLPPQALLLGRAEWRKTVARAELHLDQDEAVATAEEEIGLGQGAGRARRGTVALEEEIEQRKVLGQAATGVRMQTLGKCG